MRRLGKILLWCLGILVLLPILAVAAVLIALNTDPGRRFAERELASLTGGAVVLKGLEGRFPDRLRLAHAEIRDKQGPWLLADNLVLEWSPLALLHKQALVNRLDASLLQVPRLAVSEPAPAKPAQPSKPFSLPVRVTVEQFAVARAEVGAPVIGKDAALSLAGRADISSLEAGTAALTAHRLPVPAGDPAQPGDYALTAQVTPQRIDAKLTVQEPPNGLIATLASLPDIGPLAIDAAVTGPRSALATQLRLSAGPLTATANGTIDLQDSKLGLDLMARAPAMQPAPNVSWQAVALNAHVAGPFAMPDATGNLRLDDVKAAGAAIRTLQADLSGNRGKVDLRATLDGLRIPGPQPGLLESAPLKLAIQARLDQPGRPAAFTLSHPLIGLKGTARTAGDIVADAVLTLPDLAPLAKAGGIDLAGHITLNIKAAQANGVTTLDTTGVLAVTGGLAPAPALIGPDAKLALGVKRDASGITIDHFTLDGAAISLGANGVYAPAGVDLNARVALPNLALATPTLKGDAKLDAHAHGPLHDLALDATLTGNVGTEQFAPGPVRLGANLTGLPTAPTGRITGSGTLDGAPLQLALDASRTADGTLHATINQADWRSFHADGDLTLPSGATLPEGHVALKFTRLEDLRPLIGQPVGGSVKANVQLDPGAIILDAEADKAGLPGKQVGHASIKAHVTDPLHDPSVQAAVVAQGIDAAGVTGSARIDANGPQSALDIKATADIAASGANAKIGAAAVLNVPGKKVRLATLQVVAGNATVEPQTIRLLAPATIDYGAGVAVDRLRIGLKQAVLDVAGRFSPSLDATVTLRTPADIAAIAEPGLALNGSIALDARLTGTPAKPGGTIKLDARGIQARSGPGQAIPPANLATTVDLQGTSARLDARLAAGSANLAVNGQVPLGTGAINLRGTGGLDLALTDPILVAAGRRARGKVTLDATVTGTLAKPEIGGSMRLANGEIQDFTQGLRLTDIAGLFRFEGETLRIASLKARAGEGTIGVQGSVGVLAPTLPVDIAITMRDARPLSSDLLTATLNADLKLGGAVKTGLDASGNILIRRAELRIPSSLPTSVVTLKVIRPGEAPPAPAAPSTPINLNLTVKAPNAIFVGGRGVNAELAGALRIRGTSASPQVSGGLNMRRGTVDIAGTTLNFDTGKVGFDGTGVSGKIDPTLDFVANSTAGGITATLEITGYASNPKIKLSSDPSLPQDEVLAYLIFKRSAKELGPFQIAGIAAGLAELSGVTGGGSGPLDKVRQGLGLDRLSLGSDTNSTNKTAAPTVEAGRYVANGVYVGAKQGTTGGETQAQVQIDILKGLKLESDVGAGKGGNDVGITYQFQY